MAASTLTDFEQVLLGMICRGDSSGYDLKRSFAATPLAVYEPSSGSLYPALHRLERRGLIQPAHDSTAIASARPRRVLQATPTGNREHTRWLRQPVDPHTISRDLGLHLMRFVMMERILRPAEIMRFLLDLRVALGSFLAGLERYTANAQFTDRHPRLALEHGTAVHMASLAWTERAITALNTSGRTGQARRQAVQP